MNEIKKLKAPEDWLNKYNRHISWYGGAIEFEPHHINNKNDNHEYVRLDKHYFSKQILNELQNGNYVVVVE